MRLLVRLICIFFNCWYSTTLASGLAAGTCGNIFGELLGHWDRKSPQVLKVIEEYKYDPIVLEKLFFRRRELFSLLVSEAMNPPKGWANKKADKVILYRGMALEPRSYNPLNPNLYDKKGATRVWGYNEIWFSTSQSVANGYRDFGIGQLKEPSKVGSIEGMIIVLEIPQHLYLQMKTSDYDKPSNIAFTIEIPWVTKLIL